MQGSCQLPVSVVSRADRESNFQRTDGGGEIDRQATESAALAPNWQQTTGPGNFPLLNPDQCSNRAGFKYFLGH